MCRSSAAILSKGKYTMYQDAFCISDGLHALPYAQISLSNREYLKKTSADTGKSIVSLTGKAYTSLGGRRNMSFVGLVFHKDRIIGFGDSKASIRAINGEWTEDKARGKVNKVCRSKDMICVMYNANQIGYQTGNRLQIIPVEEWVRDNIDSYSDGRKFIFGFTDFLKEIHPTNVDDMYGLIVGYRENERNACISANVSENSMQYKEFRPGENEIICDGNSEFFYHFRFFPDALSGTKEEVKKKLEDLILYRDRILSEKGQYVPVGLPVNVEELIFEEKN